MAHELLETLDTAGTPAGLVPRDRVHADGLWHRAVHVWVVAPSGWIYVQRRSTHKDLNPDLWDVSVGEHLQPGEDYRDAAHRGLAEELGIAVDHLEPLSGERWISVDHPSHGTRDCEVQQAFRTVTEATPSPAEDEIAELRLISPAELQAWIRDAPAELTRGFHRDVADLGVL